MVMDIELETSSSIYLAFLLYRIFDRTSLLSADLVGVLTASGRSSSLARLAAVAQLMTSSCCLLLKGHVSFDSM